jgi:IS1 family transposase
MSSGRLCSKRYTIRGFGLPPAARCDRWWRMRWVIRACRTWQQLWEAILQEYRQGQCFTDFWAAYAAVIPEEQHFAVGKETGETAHMERWNNTLRQRLARFARMTLSFSMSVVITRPACSSFFIATTGSRSSCSSEPLPAAT